MKLITAIVRKEKIHDLREALVEKEILNMTVTSCQGYVHDRGYEEFYRGAQSEITLMPEEKVRLDIAVNNDFLKTTIDTIIENAATGKSGDGKIWVTKIEEVHRISTKETGSIAIARK